MMFNIKKELKKVIMNSKLKTTYNKKHPNTHYTLDEILNDIIYVLKTGISWRNLRSKINYRTVFWHYKRFADNNIFNKLFNVLKTKYFKSAKFTSITDLLLDSTIIYNKCGITKLGRNKFYKNKKSLKISLLTDSNGIPLSIFFMKGNSHDITTIDKHIKDIVVSLPKKHYRLMADKGYSSQRVYTMLDNNNISHIIPPRRNTHLYKTYKYDKTEYKKRIKIENIFSQLKRFRKVDCRYDKYMTSYKGFVYLALAFVMNYNIKT